MVSRANNVVSLLNNT